MTSDKSLQFVEHLRRHNHLMKSAAGGEPAEQGGPARQQAKLWELTNLSASEFADEAASFAKLERVTLQDMLAAPALGEAFSQRFLREMIVFPYQAADGSPVLAVADPTDTAARRAAEIVLRRDVTLKVASVEDLAVVLDRRLGDDETRAGGRRRTASAAGRRYRKSAGSCQRRACGSRRQRSAGKGRGAARQRHSH